uniref:Uncharacterized protein n=1 Tax=Cacopsylla melanoneura TaxID=428564 RepID=A0A8D8ZFV7_9HEMI
MPDSNLIVAYFFLVLLLKNFYFYFYFHFLSTLTPRLTSSLNMNNFLFTRILHVVYNLFSFPHSTFNGEQKKTFGKEKKIKFQCGRVKFFKPSQTRVSRVLE